MNIVKKQGNGKPAASAMQPLVSLQREIQKAFESAWDAFASHKFPTFGITPAWPAVDVTEDEKAVTLRADVPGMDAKDLNVEVSGNTLTVSGSREEEHKEEKAGYRRQERTSGSFSRTVTLPTYVDAGKVDAKYADGVLTVTVPKVPGQGPKRVTVKNA
jgi:HSP20 family protein